MSIDAGNELVRTTADPSGQRPVGTINNCSHGVTPWGTYLACEENFNGYFRMDPGAYEAEDQQLLRRYGVGGDNYSWSTHDARFVVTPYKPVAEPVETVERRPTVFDGS